MTVNEAVVTTRTGKLTPPAFVEPVPSWPTLLSPQQRTAPPACSPQACLPPLETATNPPAISTGPNCEFAGDTLVTSPICPAALLPQQNARPLAPKAQV